MNDIITCCFTGHRPHSLPFGYNEHDEKCLRLKTRLREEIENAIKTNNVKRFISGMAIGTDMYAAEIFHSKIEIKITVKN